MCVDNLSIFWAATDVPIDHKDQPTKYKTTQKIITLRLITKITQNKIKTGHKNYTN